MHRYRYLITALLLLYAIYTRAGVPVITWQHHFGGSELDHVKWIEQTDDSGFIIAGYTRSADGDVTYNHGPASQQDAWLMRLDKNGRLRWQRTYGGSGDDEFSTLRILKDGGFIAAGFSQSADGDVQGNKGGTDVWIVRLDTAGNIRWQHTYGGSGDEAAYCVEQTADQGFILAGYTASVNGDVSRNQGGRDYWVIRTDASGALLWQHCYGNSGSNIANAVLPMTNGDFLIAGTSDCIPGDMTMTHAHASSDGWLLRTDASGTIIWEKAFGSSGSDGAKCLVALTDSTYAVVGSCGAGDADVHGFHGGLDIWLWSVDNGGHLLWDQALGGTGLDGARSVRPGNGQLIIGGSTSSNDGDVNPAGRTAADFWLLATDLKGHAIWQKTLGNTGEDNASNALQTSDGGYVIAGDFGPVTQNGSFTYGKDDAGVAKLGFSNEQTIDACDLIQVYPVPAGSYLRINLPPAYEEARIRLNDISGKTVAADDHTGLYRQFGFGSHPAGIYLLSIEAAGRPACVRKITL